jgi:serine/threonine-protein kinase
MPSCPSCTAVIPESADVCPRCSAPTPWSAEVTRLAPGSSDVSSAETRAGATRGHSRPPTSTSWLTRTEAIDHGRFAPGTILDERYRIVGRLGHGGMGEVYRADDLKLGQPVALKFLPEAVDRDPARLTQLHTEVRMARQVSHPNVCRVYDVGGYEGHTFLSMEYVDGEDLASLLRRIGRFPEDRAIEVSRQICAGLSAAHDRGVVHRDLKPANVMLDGTGRIRITDFGLAGLTGESLRAGTPAYMAPEQLAGGEVTPRSDIYSLGLVLYELFTGRRALEGRNLAELIAKREQDGITQPSQIVHDLDPAIDRAIMRCIEPSPAQRPSSALAVAASLPGGDPLAAALAAGETPSPEMVAAAGTMSALKPAEALLGLSIALAAIVAWVLLADRLLATSLVPLPKPPVLLEDRARQILASIGYPAGIDSAHGIVQAGYLAYASRKPELLTRERLSSGNPAMLHYWYRGSSTSMVPTGDRNRVSQEDPPLTVSGMTWVVTDPEGRLVRLAVVPPQRDSPSAAQAEPVDWTPLFQAAGLDITAFTAAEPEWTPMLYADTRAAWTGPLPNLPGERLRIEAAAYRGKPVHFQQVAPWTTPSRMPQTIAQRRVGWFQGLVQLVVLAVFAAAALIARHNLRKGRGDRRGAFRLAGFITLTAIGVWALDAKHFADPSLEMSRFFIGQPLWAAALLWLLYLALEPYVRRFWPATLVSWSRLMAGQWRDPLVGRDILFGVALGALVAVLGFAASYIGLRLGYPTPPQVPELSQLLGTHMVVARTLNQMFNAVLNALFAVFGMVLLKIFVKREMAASVIAIVLVMILAVRGIFDSGPAALNGAIALLIVTMIVLTIQKLGLVATIVLFLMNMTMSAAVVTLDSSKWFFGNSLLLIAMPAALALYGFYASRGGEPLLGARVLD